MTNGSPAALTGPAGLLERVKRWFDADDWRYEQRDLALIAAFAGKNGEWPVVVEVRGRAVLVVLSLVPFQMPLDRKGAIMEAITRANYGLSLGAFDYDLDSGAVQFRTSLDVEGEEDALADLVIRHLVYQNVVAMDRYLPALQEVAEGADPEESIDRVEGR